MKVLIVHNLLSGYGDGAIYDFIRTYLEDGDEVSIRAFGGNSTFEELLHDAQNFDFVIACGGDGTISAICYALRNTDIPILPFPAGTANLLALNIFSPNEPHALCKLVDEGLTLNFDIGEIETADKTFGFTLMAGCGYDQTIMHGAKKHKHLLGDMAYFEAAFTNPKPQVSHFTITIDGTTVECDGIGVVVGAAGGALGLHQTASLHPPSHLKCLLPNLFLYRTHVVSIGVQRLIAVAGVEINIVIRLLDQFRGHGVADLLGCGTAHGAGEFPV